MDSFKKYKIVLAIWVGFMYCITTFLFPYMGWSQNKIELSQALINLALWTAIYVVIILFQKKRFNQNNEDNEKVG